MPSTEPPGERLSIHVCEMTKKTAKAYGQQVFLRGGGRWGAPTWLPCIQQAGRPQNTLHPGFARAQAASPSSLPCALATRSPPEVQTFASDGLGLRRQASELTDLKAKMRT